MAADDHGLPRRRPLIVFEDRPSDCPVIERVWRSHSERAGDFLSMAACNWVMVVTRLAGRILLTVRGPETRATTADCPADGEWVGIHFKLGTFMPLLPAGVLRDRNDVTLPEASNRSFWLNGSAWEYPAFENAEVFAKRLVAAGLIVTDPYVEAVLSGGASQPSLRTGQRRILRATGMTRAMIRQIERARRATDLLRHGTSVGDVVYDAGYFDQAHLIRSLKRFVGQTPGQLVRGEEQLSLLYNTNGP